MPEGKNKTLHIGADLEDLEFVEKYRKYCLDKDFKQKTLIYRLVDWWMKQDETIQEHIFRGRIAEAHSQIAKEVEADKIVSDSEADAVKQRQKPRRARRSKSG